MHTYYHPSFTICDVAKLLQSLLHDDNISDIPVVVLANKTDRKDAVGVEMVVNSLGLSIYRTGTVGLLYSLNNLHFSNVCIIFTKHSMHVFKICIER